MRILITGGTGTVGKALVSSLLEDRSYFLILVVRDKNVAVALFGETENIDYVSSSELEAVREKDPDVVIHLAAFITSNDDEDSMDALIDSNISFASHLLFQLQYCTNIRLFINFGTFAEYRFGPCEVNNAYLYSATKTAFKEILKYYSDKSRYRYINIIPYTIYGGNDGSKKAIDYLKDSMGSPEPVSMTNGEQVLDFIHLADVISFLDYMLVHIDTVLAKPYTDYFLGTGQGHSLRDVALMLEHKYGRKCNVDWGAKEYRPRDIMHAVAPVGRLIDIGWKAERSLEDNI